MFSDSVHVLGVKSDLHCLSALGLSIGFLYSLTLCNLSVCFGPAKQSDNTNALINHAFLHLSSVIKPHYIHALFFFTSQLNNLV